MKERLHREIKRLAVILSVGVAYLIFVLVTDLRIPCPIRMTTGLICPGCGVTRMIVSAIKLDFAAAFGYNPMLLVTLPVIIGYLIFERVRYIRTGCRETHLFCKVLLWVEIALLLVFGVVRNL